MDISKAINFISLLKKEHVLYVLFLKKDNSERLIKCTLDFTIIPKDHLPKNSINIEKVLKNLHDNKILSVYDLENFGWRSINYNKIIYVEIPSDGKNNAQRIYFNTDRSIIGKGKYSNNR